MTRDDPMRPAESFLRLLDANAGRLSRLGVPVLALRRSLQRAIDAYREAEAAGDTEAMAAADHEVTRWLRRHLQQVVAAVATPPPWEDPA